MSHAPDATTCDRARELLWPLHGPRSSSDDEADARAHLERCSDCQSFFRRDAALSAALADVSAETEVPAASRARIVEAVERASRRDAQPAFRRRSLVWAAPLAAAAAILLAALGLFRLGPQNLDALYVDSYLKRDAEPVVLSAPNLDQAYEFFMRELGLPVAPVVLGEGRVNRAMICLIEGRRTAMVEYELEGHMVAHYRGPLSSEDGGGAMHSATEDGVCVVRWSDGEFQHALVADIPEDELRVIAVQQFAALR